MKLQMIWRLAPFALLMGGCVVFGPDGIIDPLTVIGPEVAGERLAGLDGIALARAQDVARTGTAGPTDSTGRSAADRIDTVCTRDSVELIATDVDSFEAAIEQWRARPEAARILTLPRWNYFGAAQAGRVWVLDLAVTCEV